VEKPVLVRQLELERALKTRPHGLLLTKPNSTRLIGPGPRKAQDFSGNRGIAYQREPSNGREIFEADRGRRSIATDRDEEDQSRAKSGESQIAEYN
jgi:hypothetical protein